MQTLVNTQSAVPTPVSHLQPVSRENENPRAYTIEPKRLAYLDFGLFNSLCKLGVSRDRVCSAMCISTMDYDYLIEL